MAIYKIVEAVNNATGSTYSALGVIMGALATLGAYLWNLALAINSITLSSTSDKTLSTICNPSANILRTH